MGRAEELFDMIVEKGIEGIDSLVDTKTPEDLYLDYKLTATKSGDRTLHANDVKNLKKAISGFANTAGGIIIWGVKCKPNPEDGADIPTDKVPIDNAPQFHSLVGALVSGLTVPPHSGVRSHLLPTGNGNKEGFVVTLVPAADNMPLQLTDGSYYMRAGSSFVTISTPILAAMFGRRPQPILDIDIEISKEANHATQLGQRMVVQAHVILRNRGVGIAEGMYATVELNAPEHCIFRIGSSNDPHFEPAHAFGKMTSIMALKERRLPPGASASALWISLDFAERIAGDLRMQISAGTSNGPPTHRTITVSQNKLNHTLQCYLTAHVPRSWISQRVFALVED